MHPLRSELILRPKSKLEVVLWILFTLALLTGTVAIVGAIVQHTRADERRAERLRAVTHHHPRFEQVVTERVEMQVGDTVNWSGQTLGNVNLNITDEGWPFCAKQCGDEKSCYVAWIEDRVNHVQMTLPCVRTKAGTWDGAKVGAWKTAKLP